MLNLPLKPDYIVGPVLVIAFSIIFFVFEPASGNAFAFSRSHIADFEIWRLVTGHLLHTNFNHLMLNLLGLLLLWALHGQYFTAKHYLLFLFCSALFTSLAIFVFSPELNWYVGLSGVLHGLFTLGAYRDIKHGLRSGWVLLAGVTLKVLHEQWYGPSQDIADIIQASVAIDAHLYGWLCGVLSIFIMQLKTVARATRQ